MENAEVKLCALIPKIACPRSKQKREKLVKMNLTVGSLPSRSSSSRLRILTSAILRGQCGESIWRHRWLSNQLCRAISSADLPLLWFHTKALEILNNSNRLHCQIHRKRSGSRNVRANFKQSVRRNFVGFVIALLLNQANSSCVYSESQTHPNNKITDTTAGELFALKGKWDEIKQRGYLLVQSELKRPLFGYRVNLPWMLKNQ